MLKVQRYIGKTYVVTHCIFWLYFVLLRSDTSHLSSLKTCRKALACMLFASCLLLLFYCILSPLCHHLESKELLRYCSSCPHGFSFLVFLRMLFLSSQASSFLSVRLTFVRSMFMQKIIKKLKVDRV